VNGWMMMVTLHSICQVVNPASHPQSGFFG
jgi:hypothetical protein